MTCSNGQHEEEARFQCQKHLTMMCEACLKCKDPELYCKFRPSCMIHFLEKEKKHEQKKIAGSI
jgi:hypothetical protein